MTALDFSHRADLQELMDTEACGFEEFRACLRDLERVNSLTFTYRPTIAFFNRLADTGRLPKDRPFVVVDVGSGYGGMLRAIDRWAEKRGIAVALTGVDLNPWSAKAAVEVTTALGNNRRPIEWVTADLFEYRPAGGIDVLMSSQFTHHLGDDALVRFIRWMEQTAKLAWFIGDLHRHPLPYRVFRLWSRAAGWHRFVQNDGPISILRAFTIEDWRRLLVRAGIPQGAARIRWRVPFRICVERVRAP